MNRAVPDHTSRSHAFFFEIWREKSSHVVAVSCCRHGGVCDRPVASKVGMNEVIHMSFFLFGWRASLVKTSLVTYLQLSVVTFLCVSRYSTCFVLRNYKFITMFLW
jgi:hypothetical protein